MKNIKTIVIPKCPICESDDIQQLIINDENKGLRFWKYFTGNSIKTYQCNNCKLKWQEEI